MKKFLAAAIIAGSLLLGPALMAQSKVSASDEPCDPAPSQLLACRKMGGRFINCRCVIP